VISLDDLEEAYEPRDPKLLDLRDRLDVYDV
jgi:hypothetical protein